MPTNLPVPGVTTFNPHWGSHRGATDIFAPPGTPVLAMQGGRVSHAGYNDIGGYNVLVQGDDGLSYYYAHLIAPPAVVAGQRLEAGTVLGGVGDTGNAKGTGAHLHIGVGPSIMSGTGPAGGAGENYDLIAALTDLAGRGSAPATPIAPQRGPVGDTDMNPIDRDIAALLADGASYADIWKLLSVSGRYTQAQIREALVRASAAEQPPLDDGVRYELGSGYAYIERHPTVGPPSRTYINANGGVLTTVYAEGKPDPLAETEGAMIYTWPRNLPTPATLADLEQKLSPGPATPTAATKELEAALAAGAITPEEYQAELRKLAISRDPNALTTYQSLQLAQAAQARQDALRQQAIANSRAQAQLDWDIQKFGLTWQRQLEQDRLKAEAEALDREWKQLTWQAEQPYRQAQVASLWGNLALNQAQEQRLRDQQALDLAKSADPFGYLAMIRGQSAPGAYPGTEIAQGVPRVFPQLPIPSQAASLGLPTGAPQWNMTPTAIPSQAQMSPQALPPETTTSVELAPGALPIPPGGEEFAMQGHTGYGWPKFVQTRASSPLSAYQPPQLTGALGILQSGVVLDRPMALPRGLARLPGAQAQANMSPYERAAHRNLLAYQGLNPADYEDYLERIRRSYGAGPSSGGYGGVLTKGYI